MSSWREKEWKPLRKGEVVRDHDGNIGYVTEINGSLDQKTVCISNVNETEIHRDEPMSDFYSVEEIVASEFHTQRYALKGFYIGSLCSYKGDREIPLEIVYMSWNNFREKMLFCVKDRRKFNSDVMKTDRQELLIPFDENYPSLEEMFSTTDSGTKWRIDVFLAEKETSSWPTVGSPWEFFRKEDALQEVDSWKARLSIRRVASVLAPQWKVKFPCWTVEVSDGDEPLTRVKRVEAANGSPGYYETAMHASLASRLLPPSIWQKALLYSQDTII